MLYEYMITFGAEVRQIWSKKWGHSKILFVTIRYPFILAQIFYVLLILLKSDDQVCDELFRVLVYNH